MIDDDRPDHVTPAPTLQPANAAEQSRMEQVRLIQKQTTEHNIALVAKFGPPRYAGPNAATRAAEFQNLQAAFRRGVPSVTTPIILKGGRTQ